jgi:dihydrofolate synthase/folylpolyglutamate synthase
MLPALERLFARRRFGMRPGLETTLALLERLGRPDRDLAAVHVAGTNGKGSVVTLVAEALDAAGYGVGRYTSPHLLHFNERIVIRGRAVDDATLAEGLERVEAAAAAVEAAAGEPPTFFECATVLAFDLFRRAGVRLAVVEVGLGGRLDATNVLVPLVSAVTRIGLDHCDRLGNTLAAVAAEKAGIVKPGRPVVAGAMPEDALAVVRETARLRGAPFVDAAAAVTVARPQPSLSGLTLSLSSGSRDLGRVRLGLAGSFQAENAATALAALDAVAAAGVPVPDEACRAGFAAARWPGRFQLVRERPEVLVDGAHNPDAAAALARALHTARVRCPVGLVAGFCADKDVAGCLRALAPAVRRGWAVAVPSPRTLAAVDAAAAMARAGIEAEAPAGGFDEAAAAGEEWARREGGLLLVCGSLFLAGQALARYGATPSPAARPPDPNENLPPTHPPSRSLRSGTYPSAGGDSGVR